MNMKILFSNIRFIYGMVLNGAGNFDLVCSLVQSGAVCSKSLGSEA